MAEMASHLSLNFGRSGNSLRKSGEEEEMELDEDKSSPARHGKL